MQDHLISIVVHIPHLGEALYKTIQISNSNKKACRIKMDLS